MAFSDWTSATAIVISSGAFALSYFAYQRTAKLKALDLRLELRRAAADVRAAHATALHRVEEAKRSRIRVWAAQGVGSGSGRIPAFERECDVDSAALRELHPQLPSEGETYQRLSSEQLESKLVELHTLQKRIEAFKSKHEAGLAQDASDRERLRERMERKADQAR